MSIYISPNLVVNPDLAVQPLTHTRIGWQSIATSANLTGTTGENGFVLSNALNPATYERYKPSGGAYASLVVDYGSIVDVDYLGLQHRGVTHVKLEASLDNSAWTTLSDFNLGTDKTVMSLVDTVSARYYRVTLTGSGIEVIAFKVGKSLAMQRAIYGGHTPITLAPVRVIRPNVSETGQWLGASEQRKGFSTSFEWTNITAGWYREFFDPFVQNSPRIHPFFIAWRPSAYPSEVAYCLATKDVRPSNAGRMDFMSMSLQVEGFSDVV